MLPFLLLLFETKSENGRWWIPALAFGDGKGEGGWESRVPQTKIKIYI